ncbi:hypothetical protein A3K80_04375 [Candidatus Bathyarchaeota archaeon RBG_13_38_9]|nr:MAG: hypothetical protein A3K80_04375 [Candidatus Bathyarchaeota archaeon RBG_13_38_9]
MNVLVTGGAGFIGSHIVDRLLSQGYFVFVIDNFDNYYSQEIKANNIRHNQDKKNFKLIRGDIRNSDLLRETLKDMDIVFHVAARPGVRGRLQDSRIYHEFNVTGTLCLLNECLNSNIKKVIFSSSSSVYGESKYLPIDEKHPLNPISFYGATKLAGEKYCRIFSEIYGLPIIVLRYFTVFGPRQRPDEAICKFTRLILRGERVEIYGNGEQTRDFTYIDDVVVGNMLAFNSETKWGTFNIGGGQRLSINELLKLLNEACGTNVMPVYCPKTIGDVSNTWANVDEAQRILGYVPKVDVRTGIKKYVEWAINQVGSGS